MALDIGAALRNGITRTFQRNGLLLMVVFLVFGAASAVVSQSLSRAAITAMQQLPTPAGQPTPPALQDMGPTPFALPIPLPAAAVLAIGLAILAEAVHIVAVRTLVSDVTTTIPGRFVSRHIGWATINGFIGGIVVVVLTAIGLVLLVIPGIYLALSFFFVRQEIAVEDENFVDAMAGSWSLAAGNRIELLGLAIILLVITLVASVPTFASTLLGPSASVIVGVVVGAVTTVLNIAVAARAYDQLRTERDERLAEGEDGTDEDDGLSRAGEESEFEFEV